ncbi:MAG TPA: peptide deformylase, partial [Flavobacteriales bacterium]|nr:peptide deformylase [Flavobacteriales bacterium]
PVFAYGHPVLRKLCEEISPTYPEINKLIEDMFETMKNAQGIGLAAPQIGIPIRLFIVDGSPIAKEEENEELENFRKVFINAEMLSEDGDAWDFNEGCLSIPEIREPVSRKPYINIRYYDEEFNQHIERFSDIQARIIQHEYDHIEGKLFVDHLNALKRRLLKRKLTDISKGKVDIGYKMKFPLVKSKLQS